MKEGGGEVGGGWEERALRPQELSLAREEKKLVFCSSGVETVRRKPGGRQQRRWVPSGWKAGADPSIFTPVGPAKGSWA